MAYQVILKVKLSTIYKQETNKTKRIKNMTIKLRFAPSPTGHLHVGNMRAALINWLFAKKMDGIFLLRIDDTDKERSKKEYKESIKADFKRLGMKWDELEHQSARFPQYEAAKNSLIESGRLYPCYETAEELGLKRKSQLAAGKPPIYDRAGLKLSDEEIAEYEAEGRKPHWRFKLNHTPIIWTDLVQGECKFHGENLSDPIVIREDGSYLYTLPSCVDDVEFKISHIVRGVDHLANTASHVQIIEALGGKCPEFVHLPLLSGADGAKLSKRIGSLTITGLIEEVGVEPMALLSMLAKLGTSDAIEPRFSLEELANELDFSKVSRSSAKFDEEMLTRINTKMLHDMPFETAKTRLEKLIGTEVDENFWEAVKPNLNHLKEAADWWRMAKTPLEPVIEDASFTAEAATLLPDGDLTSDSWGIWINAVKDKTGRKGKMLFMPLRQALTGQNHGPELQVLLPLIGRDRTLKRLSGKCA